jgi:outer membrane protein TolC
MKNRRFNLILLFVTSLILVFPAISAGADEDLPVTRIAFLYDGPMGHEYIDRSLIEEELKGLLIGEHEIVFSEGKNITADWTREGVEKAIDQLFLDDGVDIIVAVGLISSVQVSLRTDIPKPVIGSFIVNPEAQGIPKKGLSSGVKNLNYITFSADLAGNLQEFQKLAPFKAVAILVNQKVMKEYPYFALKLETRIREVGYKAKVIGVGEDIDKLVKILADKADAVYLMPMLNLSTEKVKSLIDKLNEAKLPTFSDFSRRYVEWGTLASLTPESEKARISRRIAINIERIVLGEDPGDIPVSFTAGKKLTVNLKTAKALDRWPSFDILTTAEFIGKETVRDFSGDLSLRRVVLGAIDNNLDILARKHGVAAGKQNVNEAITVYLPQVDVLNTARMLDSDTAIVGRGLTPEYLWANTVSARQLFFSEKAMANLSIQKKAQLARELDFENLKLDIALRSAVLYLNVLQATAFERIEKENFELTKRNLEIAQARVDTGVASKGEVYRWESQLANNKQAVIDAMRRRIVAEVAVSGILNFSQKAHFKYEDVELHDPDVFPAHDKFFPKIDDPKSYTDFIDFMVQEGFKTVPELKSLDAIIGSQKRRVTSEKLDFILPDAEGFYNVDSIMGEAGDGRAATGTNDFSWSAGVEFSFPLFEGGSKFTGLWREKEILKELQIGRDSAANKVETRIRTNLYSAVASFQNIKFAYEARDSAKNNLDLVIKAYRSGVASILDLLDAQNAALVADQQAATAVYEFSINYFKSERSVGRFGFLLSEEERADWRRKLIAYLQTKR